MNSHHLQTQLSHPEHLASSAIPQAQRSLSTGNMLMVCNGEPHSHPGPRGGGTVMEEGSSFSPLCPPMPLPSTPLTDTPPPTHPCGLRLPEPWSTWERRSACVASKRKCPRHWNGGGSLLSDCQNVRRSGENQQRGAVGGGDTNWSSETRA